MQDRILLAVDGSEKCKDAISSLGQLLKTQPDSRILLYHCVQRLGIDYLSDLARSVHTYHVSAEAQKKVGEAILDDSLRVLLESEFPEDRVQAQLRLDSDDPAQDILDEAKRQDIGTIAIGRRGLSRMESLLIGSVSSKIAQYSGPLTVWIVDTPLHASQKALIAVQGITGGSMLSQYASDVMTALPYSHYTFLHLIPPVPPIHWHDSRLLPPKEPGDRQAQIEKHEAAYRKQFEQLMAQGRDSLVEHGIASENVKMRIEPIHEGIARDLLNEIEREKYQMVVIGKKSLQKKTPFLLGSLASKLMHNAKGVILCLVGSL